MVETHFCKYPGESNPDIMVVEITGYCGVCGQDLVWITDEFDGPLSEADMIQLVKRYGWTIQRDLDGEEIWVCSPSCLLAGQLR